MKKIVLYFALVFVFLSLAFKASAYQPNLVYLQQGSIQINNRATSQFFFDELKGSPRDYFIDLNKDFQIYVNLLVPEVTNGSGRYSLEIFDSQDNKIYSVDGTSFEWKEIYDDFGRDYYLKGPEFTKQLSAGKYKIEVFSKDNTGKYVLSFGKNKALGFLSTVNIYWQVPFLKLTFLKTPVLQFFLTPFGIYGIGFIGIILIILALINYLSGLIKENIKHNEAKTLLLTSGGMPEMKDEIIKLLQKPAYDVTVAFITTAAKPIENIEYLQRDWLIMKEELGFNMEEVDIEGKTEGQVKKLLENKDIIFVEGGSTFYLLKAMRACNFEKVIREFLKNGVVYIGVSAGSIVAGRTIQTANIFGTGSNGNNVGLKNLKGLGLVPFDIFVHYKPEHAEIIRQKMPDSKKRGNNLKILTDSQAILVQGKEVDLIGDGEVIII